MCQNVGVAQFLTSLFFFPPVDCENQTTLFRCLLFTHRGSIQKVHGKVESFHCPHCTSKPHFFTVFALRTHLHRFHKILKLNFDHTRLKYSLWVQGHLPPYSQFEATVQDVAPAVAGDASGGAKDVSTEGNKSGKGQSSVSPAVRTEIAIRLRNNFTKLKLLFIEYFLFLLSVLHGFLLLG